MSTIGDRSIVEQVEEEGALLARPIPQKRNFNWVVLMPFLLFVFLVLLLPSVSIIVRSFESPDTHGFTINNILEIFRRSDLRAAYRNSLMVSTLTAVVGGVFGFLLAYAVTSGGMPKALRNITLTFSGVASNFAGVPLAFAFIATIGNTGLVTRTISYIVGTDIARQGWSVYNIWGLSVVYLYFQFPLMVLVIAPALDGILAWRHDPFIW
jgi:putative spermidine/putrescine transport system permease protein